MQSGTRPLLVVVGWIIAASVATTVGLLAVGAVGASVIGTQPSALSQEQVERALTRGSQSTSPQPEATAPQPKATAPTTPEGVSRVLATPGGTIIARCHNGDATLLSWSPAQGFNVEEIHAGPARTATLFFDTGRTQLQVRVTCDTGVPTSRTTAHTDHDNDHD